MTQGRALPRMLPFLENIVSVIEMKTKDWTQTQYAIFLPTSNYEWYVLFSHLKKGRAEFFMETAEKKCKDGYGVFSQTFTFPWAWSLTGLVMNAWGMYIGNSKHSEIFPLVHAESCLCCPSWHNFVSLSQQWHLGASLLELQVTCRTKSRSFLSWFTMLHNSVRSFFFIFLQFV